MSQFKSIILFHLKHAESEDLKTQLATLANVKVFNTTTLDEIQQIVDMSSKSAIICDDDEALETLKDNEFKSKRGLYRKYFINWDMNMSNLECSKVGESNVTVLRSKKIKPILNKFELYLYGKINIFNRHDYKDDEKYEFDSATYQKFFTLLEYEEQNWHVVISSHEREDLINTVLNKNWEALLDNIINIAPTITKPLESVNPNSSYYEIVHPHKKEGKINQITIVHLIKCPDLKNNILKVREFLKSI
jgi:hypothetical protein